MVCACSGFAKLFLQKLLLAKNMSLENLVVTVCIHRLELFLPSTKIVTCTVNASWVCGAVLWIMYQPSIQAVKVSLTGTLGPVAKLSYSEVVSTTEDMKQFAALDYPSLSKQSVASFFCAFAF